MQPLVDAIWNFGAAHTADAVTGAIGAFFGAFVAFLFERSNAERESRDARGGDLLEAHMILVCHANSLYDERQKIARFRSVPERERKMPYIVHTFDQATIDVRKISFLLSSPVPDLVLDIHTADMCYRSACRSLEVRNQMINDLRASMDIQNHDPATGRTGGIVDLTTYTLLRQATDSVFDCLDDAFAKNMGVIRAIHKHGKILFPGSTFREIAFPPLPSDNDAHDEPTNKG